MNKYFEVNAVLSLFSKNYMDLKKNLPIRPSEMGVLNIITQTPGPHTSVMLADLLGVSKPMITAHLSVLSNEEYIVKKQSPDDKRVYFILPTDKALTLVRNTQKVLNQQLDHLTKEMGQDAFDTFVKLAQTANEIMKKENL